MDSAGNEPNGMNVSGSGQDDGRAGDATTVPDEVVCAEFVELITDYFDDALAPRTLTHVEEHLVLCDWCRAYLQQMRATVSALGGLGERVSAEPSDAVLTALRSRRGAQ